MSRDLKLDLEKWLKENNLSYSSAGDQYSINGEYGEWIIIVDARKRGKAISFSAKIMNAIKEVDGKVNKVSLLIERDNNNITEFKNLSAYVKESLNLSLLAVNAKGVIKEYH